MTHMDHSRHVLRARNLAIDTHHEAVVYMPSDCHVCLSEGFQALGRVELEAGGKRVVASLHVADGLVNEGEAALSKEATRQLGTRDGDLISVHHIAPLASMSHVRSKLFGHDLGDPAFREIIQDIVAGRYANTHIAAFLAACTGDRMTANETLGLSRAMIDVGQRLDWGRPKVMDKHCVGGLPGNRTTPIVVAIAAEAGLCMPKTSSKAITSPAGTADTMATMTRVDLTIEEMRRVVEASGACLAWGGAVHLSPADDILVRVERMLDLDSEAQLVASILSKKAAAGATHVVIDVPVGPTAKVRDAAAAARLRALLIDTGRGLGLNVDVVLTDGAQPVGNGIGPALEARDVLEVLEGSLDMPGDLRDRALDLASQVLELGGAAPRGEGRAQASRILESGRAMDRFKAICQAQGGFRRPPESRQREAILARHAGHVISIDNRRLAQVAKLAGAPDLPAAGVDLQVRVGFAVNVGQPLYEVYSDSPGALAYALDYVASNPDIIIVTNGRPE